MKTIAVNLFDVVALVGAAMGLLAAPPRACRPAMRAVQHLPVHAEPV